MKPDSTIPNDRDLAWMMRTGAKLALADWVLTHADEIGEAFAVANRIADLAVALRAHVQDVQLATAKLLDCLETHAKG